MLKRQFQNSVVAFPVGPILEMSWAFRKDDKDLQAAADKFLKAQRDQKDSLLNQQFKNLYEMSVPEFSAMDLASLYRVRIPMRCVELIREIAAKGAFNEGILMVPVVAFFRGEIPVRDAGLLV